MDALYSHARFEDLNLDARSQWVGKGKTISIACYRQISIKRATTVGQFYMTLTLSLLTFILLVQLVFHVILFSLN